MIEYNTYDIDSEESGTGNENTIASAYCCKDNLIILISLFAIVLLS